MQVDKIFVFHKLDLQFLRYIKWGSVQLKKKPAKFTRWLAKGFLIFPGFFRKLFPKIFQFQKFEIFLSVHGFNKSVQGDIDSLKIISVHARLLEM